MCFLELGLLYLDSQLSERHDAGMHVSVSNLTRSQQCRSWHAHVLSHAKVALDVGSLLLQPTPSGRRTCTPACRGYDDADRATWNPVNSMPSCRA